MTKDQFDQKYGTGKYANGNGNQSNTTPSHGGMDWLPGVTGTVGQVLGGIGGAALGGFGGAAAGAAVPVADLTGVPEVAGAGAGGFAGERIGQTAGGAVGQGAGEWLREALTGEKADAGNIANNAGQGALWAQVPGGKMAEGIANPLLKMGAKALIRGGGGAVIGGGTKAMQNVQDGKPIGDNVLTTGAETGATNAILPGLTGLAGKSFKAVAGNSSDILKNIERYYVGEEASRNPDIIAHIEHLDPIKTISNLHQAGQDTMGDLSTILKSKTGNAQNFIDSLAKSVDGQFSLTNSAGKAQKWTDTIGRYLKNYVENNPNAFKDFDSELEKTKLSGTGGENQISPKDLAGSLLRELKKNPDNAISPIDAIFSSKANPSENNGQGKIMHDYLVNKINSQGFKNTDIPLSVLNKIKQEIGNFYESKGMQGVSKPMYSAAKQFIEENAGEHGPIIADLNDQYSKLKDSRDFMSDKFTKAQMKVSTGKPLNIMDKLMIAGPAAMAGTAAGIGSGSLYSAAGVGLPTLVLSSILNKIKNNPETAVPYANNFLKPAESAGTNVIAPLLEKLGVRVPGMVNQ